MPKRSEPTPERAVYNRTAERISTTSGGVLRLVSCADDGSPRLIIADPTKSTPLLDEDARQDEQQVSTAAERYVRSIATNALLLPTEAILITKGTVLVGNSWHVLFDVTYGGIPLRDRHVHVHIGALNGSVMVLRSSIPSASPVLGGETITPEQAFDVAETDYSGGRPKPYTITQEPTLVYVNLPTPTDLRLAYETIISDGFHQLRYTIDARTADLLEKRDMVECNYTSDPGEIAPDINRANSNRGLAEEQSSDSTGVAIQQSTETVQGRVTAAVHLHTPTDTLTIVGLGYVTVTVNNKSLTTDSLGYWSTDATYPVKVVSTLSGPYYSVSRQDGKPNGIINSTFASGSCDIRWDDSNADPAERDAAYAVGEARAHVASVDTGIVQRLKQRLLVKVNESNTCNAFYDPTSVSLNFFAAGSGCVNTAQIADVVAHEFGHRVNHARYLVAGAQYMTDLSLNEGFADLSSNFLRDDPVIGKGFTGKNSTLRTSDNKKQWPKDISPDAHMTGTIIAGAIWDYRKLVGHDIAEREFNLCGYHTPDGTGFNDPASIRDVFLEVLTAMFLVDDDNNNLNDGTPHAAELLKAFQLHNLGIQNYGNIEVDPIADGKADDWFYPVTVRASFEGPVGTLNSDSVKLYYSTDAKTYSSVALAAAGNGTFTGSIPRLPQHSLVRYYVSASTNYVDAGRATFPMYTTQPFEFVVSYDSKFVDNCETDKGWTFGLSSDAATNGLWTFGTPDGSVDVYDDHSVDGSNCVLTSSPVSGGATTATTYKLDLAGMSDPVVRFWFYFSNDKGTNGGAPVFKSSFSTNGSSYKTLQTTSLSSNGWKPYAFRVKDVTSTLNSSFTLRFAVSDYVAPSQYPQMNPPPGTISEAGIDDIEILDVAPLGVNEASVQNDIHVWPNPVDHGAEVTLSGQQIHAQTATLVDILGTSISVSLRSRPGGCSFVIPGAAEPGVYQLIVSGFDRPVKVIVR
ncbi:MAG: hypothetical protein JSS75_12530 [Bacteroidetes bacterium]|nr:hypothetical protein [Bacteroidota bacterium]